MSVKEIINQLIDDGHNQTFHNNSYSESHGTYGTLSAGFREWHAKVEELIRRYYGEDSGPMNSLKRLHLNSVYGNQERIFNEQHALIMGALKACLLFDPMTNQSRVPSQDFLNLIFNSFHKVTIQLRSRFNGRETLDIKDEYDVQDLLHALLKLYFNDIRKEEWTPSYAGGSSRMDFLLKEEQTVIEVKKTRVGLDDKELGKQLIIDKAKYKAHPDCKRLVCFTYDPEGRILNPKGIENDLNTNEKDFVVDIVIKPNN